MMDPRMWRRAAVLASVAATRTGSLEAAGHPAAESLTGGFSWAFLGAAAFAIAGAAVAAATVRGSARSRSLR